MFDAVRPWLATDRSLEGLNRAAAVAGVRTQGGLAVQFVAPSASRVPYETQVFESGRIPTRPDNLHDWFNALAWLAFPRTKARMNAIHAAEIPREQGRRGRLRDLLTIFDEGGALIACADEALVRRGQWKELFWAERERVRQAMRIAVLGHAVLEQALEPRPGITCKALFVDPEGDIDAQAARWLAEAPPDASPRDLAPLPIFGYPGWSPEGEHAAFYDDARYFRPQGT